jgi:outer membrane protein TolC
MNDDTMHQPTPDFRNRLEWEVTRAHRRAGRLGEQRQKRGRRLRGVAIVMACIGISVATGIASAQVRYGAQRDSLLEAARADLELIMLRFELAKAHVDEVMKLARVGAAGTEAVVSAEAELREMEARVVRARLNMEEIRATSQTPRDELTAPLVGKRDFVQERLQLELIAAQQQLTAAERAMAETQRRVSIGTVSESARAEAEVELVRAQASLAFLADRRALRREFVEKGTGADDLARRLSVAQTKMELEIAQQALNLARIKLDALMKLRDVGTVTRLEVMRAEVELRERELELNQLRQRRQRLEEIQR